MTPRPLWEAVWFCKCSPTEKFILDCIAFHASPGGGNAWPSVRRVAILTGLARSTVETHLATLIGRGYLTVKRHGNQKSSNVYQINIGKLMENALPENGRKGSVPALRFNDEGVPASGTGGIPASGTDEAGGVPTEDRGVSRLSAKGVPASGTEQTPTEVQNIKGEKAWNEIKTLLLSIDRGRDYLWKAVIAAELEGLTLRLTCPNREIADLLEAQCESIYMAADRTGQRVENVSLRAPIAYQPQSQPTPLAPPKQWRRSH